MVLTVIMDSVQPTTIRTATEKQDLPPSYTKTTKERINPVNGNMATIHDDDERLLARIGYKQVS